MSALGSCRAAQLTPPGRGAVATIAVWGDEPERIVEQHFHAASGRALSTAPLSQIVFGRWGDTHGEELVVVRVDLQTVEIHSHGGFAAPTAILAALESSGVEIASADDWLASRCADPIVLAASQQLAKAPTLRTARHLVDQLHGALSREFATIRQLRAEGDHTAADARRDRLVARSAIGIHLTRPYRVVIAGAPNVGKSSLINALVGYERSIVFDQPGTTRDVVTALASFDGWPIELCDTAGLRTSDDPLETAGVALAEQQMREADLIVAVYDASHDWRASYAEFQARFPQALSVFNKCDQLVDPLPRVPGLLTSAVTRRGLPELLAQIVQILVPDPPQAGDAIPFTPALIAEAERL